MADTKPSKNRLRDSARDLAQAPVNPTKISARTDAPPLTPGEQAKLDQIEAGLRDNGPQIDRKGIDRSLPKPQALLSKIKKRKKLLTYSGIGIAALLPVVFFLFWLMLFKNVHIKNLYVTYRWAQFNRGLNKALKGQLEYAKENRDAKPGGTAEDTVSPSDSLDDLTKKTNAEEVNSDKLATEAELAAETDKRTSLGQDVGEGPNAEAISQAGGDGAVDAATGEGDTEEDRAKSAEDKAKSNVEEDLSKAADAGKEAPESIRNGVDEAKKPGNTPEDGVKVITEGGGSWQKTFSKASSAVFVITMYCIFRDLYTTARDQLVKIAVNSSMITAQELNKTADCQKNGKCTAQQIGAVAERYDNDKESFMDSCGADRAQQNDTANCKEINPKFIVNGLAKEVGGATGGAIQTTEALLDPPIPGNVVGITCSTVMNPFVQLGITAVEATAIVSSGGGWAALGKAAASGTAAFIGTAGGKALLASAISKYTGAAYKKLGPVDLGNLTDMGNLADSSAACAKVYCPQVDNDTVSRLDQDYRTERIAANSKKSVLEKFFDNNSPDSVLSRVAISAPANPSAIIGRLGSFMGTIMNPATFTKSLGKSTLALAAPPTAYAYDSSAAIYGLDNKVTVPPTLLDDTSYGTVNAWSKSISQDAMSGLENKYKVCASDSYATRVGSDDKTCSWNDMDSSGKMFMRFKYLQSSNFYGALLHNKQSNIKGGGSGAPTGATANKPGPIFLIGDSITEGLITGGGIKEKLSAKSFQPVTNDSSSGRSFTGKGNTAVAGTTTSAFEALALPANTAAIKSSEYVFVGIGTNPAGNVPANYGQQVDQTVDQIKTINSSVKIYWMNVFSPFIVSRTERNLILAERASKKGFTVINADSISAKIAYDALKLHPKDGANYGILADFVVDSLAAASGGNASPISGDRATLNTRLLGNPLLKLGNYQSASVQRGDITGGKVTDNLVKAMIIIVEQAKIVLPVNALKSDHKPGTLHGAGKAVDMGYRSGDATGTTLFKFIYDNRAAINVDELIWKNPPAGYKCLKKGEPVDCVSFYTQKVINEHESHIHLGVK